MKPHGFAAESKRMGSAEHRRPAAEQAALDAWTSTWSPYTAVDEAGTLRRLLKAAISLPHPASDGDTLELVGQGSDVLDREDLPIGREGIWAHGFWVPAPKGVLRARLRWISRARLLAERRIEIPAPDLPAALPLRSDALGLALRAHLERREEAARRLGPDNGQTPGHLGQHDLIYLRPAPEWDEGLPLGNGDLGALVCGGERFQVFYLDKADIWLATASGLPAGRCYAAALRVEWSGRRRPFRQRLRLASAEAETRHGAVTTRARVHALRNCFQLDSRVPAGAEVTITLERESIPLHPEEPGLAALLNGSWERVMLPKELAEAQRRIAEAPRTRLEWGAQDRDVWLLHSAPNLRVAVAVRALGGDGLRAEGGVSRQGLMLRAGRDGRLRVLAAVATDREGDDPLALARRVLDACGTSEQEARTHRAWWRRFWRRSWVDLPDKFEENLWYMGVYQQACTSRGPQAVGFFGLWHPLDNRGWRDAYVADAQVPMMWWSCFATNHLDLLFPSHNTFGALALECAEHSPGAGMVVPHQFDPVWAGGHQAFTGRNPYNGSTAWFTLNFWWDYLHSGDRLLLERLAYPLLRMAADYHADDLREGPDRRLHCHGSGAPEQINTACDNIYDWALLRALFQAAGRAAEILGVDAGPRACWADALARLYPMPGDGQVVWETRDNQQPYRCHPVMMMGLYPGTVGYGSAEFHAIRRTLPIVTSLFGFRYADRHETAIPGHEGGVEPNAFSSGMLAIAHARLGDVASYRRSLYGLIVRCHLKRNGLRALADPRQDHRICRAHVVEGANAHTVAITETLLQCWPDHVRLFPCVGASGVYRFAGLRAFGSFLVAARCRDGELTDAEIGSLQGGDVMIAWPWRTEGLRIEEHSEGSSRSISPQWVHQAAERRLRLQTRSGARYRLSVGEAPAMRSPVPRRTAPRRVAIAEVETFPEPLIQYPEDLPFGQIVEDAYLYLGNPARPAEARPGPRVAVVAGLASSPAWTARQEAARLLGRPTYDDARAVPLLAALCGDQVPVVAQTAGTSLVRRGTEQSLAEARRAASESPVPGVRREIEKALLRWRREVL